MKERLRSLVLLASGLVLIGAGLLGLHLSQPGGPPAMGIVQPPASYLRSEGMRSARLFPGLKVLAVYTYRAPDLKRQTGGVSGIFSQVLAILGNPSGAVLAVKEYVGPPSDPTMEVAQLGQGWSTALPPSAYPVHPERLRELRGAVTSDVARWLHTGGARGCGRWSGPSRAA